MDPFSIAALVAAVVGAGVQYKAQTDAAERQQREIAASLLRQDEYSRKAEKKALDTAQTYAPDKRMVEQDQLAAQIEQSLIQPVAESQAIRNQQTTTQGDVSQDYTAAKARSELETMKQAEGLARLLGKTSSANRLRLNEGVRLMDAGMDVDRLGNFARGQYGADQIAIQQAGNPNAGQMFLGSVLQGLGSAGMAYGGSMGKASSGLTGGSTFGAGVGYGSVPQETLKIGAFQAPGAGFNTGIGMSFGR